MECESLDRRRFLKLASTGMGAAMLVPWLQGADAGPTVIPDGELSLVAHPRLILTSAAVAQFQARLESDDLVRQLFERLKARSDLLAGLPKVPFATVPFAEFGIQMLEVSRSILERCMVHGFLLRVTGETDYAQRLWREVETALEYPTWNPAHFLDAAEMLLAMACAYDWGYDRWTMPQKTALREAMVNRAMTRGLEIYRTRQGLSHRFVASTTNWNSVSNSGMLAAALAVADEEPTIAAEIVRHATASIANALRGYEPEGASEEGPTYWAYGTDFLCVFNELLQSASPAHPDLLTTSAIARTTLYRLHAQAPSGRTYSYADCWPHAGVSAAYARLSDRFGPQPARDHVRDLIRRSLHQEVRGSGYRLLPLAVLWLPPQKAESAEPAVERDAFFSGKAHLAMMRGAWGDTRSAFLGFKAGHALHAHAHLDLGSFVYDWNGLRWSADLGPDSYSLPGYFRYEGNTSNPLNEETRHLPHRWSYFRTTNRGHSTLTLAGDLQSRTAFAPMIVRKSSPNLAFAVADLGSAYPGRVQTWRRGVALLDRTWVAVRDELTGVASGVEAEWILITEAGVEIVDERHHVRLRQSGSTVDLVVVSGPAQARFSVESATPATPDENPNRGVSRLRFHWIAQESDVTLEIHLRPAGQDLRPTLGPLREWTT